MSIRPFRIARLIAGLAIAVSEVVVRDTDAPAFGQVDIPLLDISCRLAVRSMPADRDQTRDKPRGAVWNIQQRGVRKPRIRFVGDSLHPITVSLQDSMMDQVQVTRRWDPVVKSDDRQDLLSQDLPAL